MRTSIAIVDDNRYLIRSISQNLACFEEIEILFTAYEGGEVLEKLKNIAELPQVILMDIEMEPMDGITATALIRKYFPDIKIIILSVFTDDDKIFEAIRAGASGYLLKDEKSARIVDAIEQVVEGGAPMSPSIAQKTLQWLRNAPPPASTAATLTPQSFDLTKRELEILEHIAIGLTYQQIGDKLFISSKTVRKHTENIYQKLHVHSKVEAIQLANKHNWLGNI
ncbi:response regulator transcription factor [Cytophagaceae bacterium DM2B3-1]|uniref:Response regulator transcription factor n=1 Tax=Xanthocytophaga flava TaxID=3048013 RepID=A0ABT7CEP0_9BACT|nr:response regulator transcription factor [Xanthocytophaga flavus]MDJ1469037.1 response regulator transcription factor [Xanthocytophaga flavus]MDJ1492212.1 response regulator transcription factor [Xanthocytophaga flavus]